MRVAVVVGITVTLAGCGLLDPGDGSAENPILPLEGRLHVRPFEGLTPDGSVFELRVVTEQEYGCGFYVVRQEVFIREQQAFVRFLGVQRPRVCLDTFGSAMGTVVLPGLGTGDAELILEAVGRTTGVLSITDSTFRLGGFDTTVVTWDPTEFKRIPGRLVWGVVSRNPDVPEAAEEEFLAGLAALGGTPVTLPPADYGWFTIDGSGHASGPILPPGRFFALQFEGNPSRINPYIRRFREPYGISMRFYVFTWRGERFEGW